MKKKFLTFDGRDEKFSNKGWFGGVGDGISEQFLNHFQQKTMIPQNIMKFNSEKNNLLQSS